MTTRQKIYLWVAIVVVVVVLLTGGTAAAVSGGPKVDLGDLEIRPAGDAELDDLMRGTY